ncbi:MAG: hypothetical protein MHM6MM_002186 [Cercozoa sp. M6MM]
MTTRDLTEQFRELRERMARPGRRSAVDDDGVNASLIGSALSDGAPRAALPPVWVDLVDSIERDIKGLTDDMDELKRLHMQRAKVTFDSAQEEAQDAAIDAMRHKISGTFRRAEGRLKRIAFIGNDSAHGSDLSNDERQVRLNVMRSLGARLQDLSRQYRQEQQRHMRSLQSQEDEQNALFGDTELDDDVRRILSLENVDRGLTEEQMNELDMAEERASRFEREVIHVARSVSELAVVFRELSVLVLEQGTILDRIDYHVEQARSNLERGNEELDQAEKYSRSARTTQCIVVLLIMIILMTGIMILKDR